MKEFINRKEILQRAEARGRSGEHTAKFFAHIIGVKKLNNAYAGNYRKKGNSFIEGFLSDLDIDYEIDKAELGKIPETGSFITVSNHPLGGLDSLLLIKLISQVRPDYRLVGSFLVNRMKPLQDMVFNIDPISIKQLDKSDLPGLKEIFNHFKNDHPVGIFPSGEVALYNLDKQTLIDREWQYSVVKVIKRAKVPVVPVYFQCNFARFFHLFGIIHPAFKNIMFSSEVFNKKNKIIHVRIGQPITVKEQNQFKDISQYGRYLRAKTYALGTSFEVGKFFQAGLKPDKSMQKVIAPVSGSKIQDEISSLGDEYLLFKSQNYTVYCVHSLRIPNILTEIDRLREITFRDVGEGTNRNIDIDEFDLYYHQLFIWDEEKKMIVGAYRVGKGKDILAQYGKKGFYIQSLFKIKNSFSRILEKSIELGRSFIVKEYQRKPLPLFLLWKGILYFLLKNPEYRFLIGPVSISNQFSDLSKELIIEFIQSNYFHPVYARFIKPRKAFTVQGSVDLEKLIEQHAAKDLNKFDRLVKDIDPENSRMPVLLKKYLQLNGKIIGFNIDPKFNNALDGLMILDLFEVPLGIIEGLSKEINDTAIMERFNLQDVLLHKRD